MSRRDPVRKPWKYRPGPARVPGTQSRGKAPPKLWLGYDEHGQRCTTLPRYWMYLYGGKVERTTTAFLAFDKNGKQLGEPCEFVSEAAARVEKAAAVHALPRPMV